MSNKIKQYNIDELPPIMRRLIEFVPVDGVPYFNQYQHFFDDPEVIVAAEQYVSDPDVCDYTNNRYLLEVRNLLSTDPFFIVHIAMGNPFANDEHGFVNRMCAHALNDLQLHYAGIQSLFLDVWAREHYKSSIKTRAIPIIHVFNNPTNTVLIQAANVKLAQTLLAPIKSVLEMKEVTAAYSDILFREMKDAKKWTESELKFNCDNARGENTFEVAGLLEGQKIGRHYDMILSDDVETLDLARNPDQLAKLKESYYYSLSMMASKSFINVVGTYYSHLGLLVELRDTVWADTKDYMYNYRRVPMRNADGELELFTPEKARIVSQDRASCRTQYELDPTPRTDAQFRSEDLKIIEHKDVPANLFKIMIIDPAGNKTRNGDDWFIGCLGFQPNVEHPEALDIFVLDMDLMPMSEIQARQSMVRIYGNNGLIQAVCYEHMGQGDYLGRDIIASIKEECHVELVEDYTLIKLFPQGRGCDKKTYITRQLAVPFSQGRVYMSTAVAPRFRQRASIEIDQYMVGKDDFMDGLAYYEMALDKVGFRYKKNGFFNRNVLQMRDRRSDFNGNHHPQGWMAM